MIEAINKLLRTTRQLVRELGREPTSEEIAMRMYIHVDRVRKILKIAQLPISLETPIGEEDDSHLGDFIEDKAVFSPSDEVINLNLKEQIASVLKTLTPREEKIIKIRFIRFAHTHDRVCAPPIDLHGSIRLRNGTTGKDHVVDIPGDFPGIFRLQNPRVAHADDLCRVQQVMQSNPQTIDRSIHRSENSVIDGKPSLVRFDRRRAGTDLHFIPVI